MIKNEIELIINDELIKINNVATNVSVLNYLRIDKRIDIMIDEGWVEEVKKLLELNLNDSLPVMRAHGVPEIKKYLANESSLEECISKGQQVTRNYVKRQHTWWNSSKLDIFQKFDKFPSEIDLNSIKID